MSPSSSSSRLTESRTVLTHLPNGTSLSYLFCEQAVETLIRRCVLRRLIWICTGCQCPTKRTLGFHGLMNVKPQISRLPSGYMPYNTNDITKMWILIIALILTFSTCCPKLNCVIREDLCSMSVPCPHTKLVKSICIKIFNNVSK